MMLRDLVKNVSSVLLFGQAASYAFGPPPSALDPYQPSEYVEYGPAGLETRSDPNDRVFIPYIFKRSYHADEDDNLGIDDPADLHDSSADPPSMWSELFNHFSSMKSKRGASQYYLLHFGMPGVSSRSIGKPQQRNFDFAKSRRFFE
ncbi:Oidioi.mRNA.OKI2018_I69.chr1.g3069.t2.cds [Oikopleura dioica]|uniref:Oidioi.mRNA.OKI2018_I69.chr1.g3069.t2.cds n=1 Tax=Oikopleura dioica TaxID=34765 RepID=A0ABN7ST12_OIKDI|nr:Oidioi.mRNA.OKI2018_I69.chr1.g3069.t2.cds [Oikopleura dioica]